MYIQQATCHMHAQHMHSRGHLGAMHHMFTSLARQSHFWLWLLPLACLLLLLGLGLQLLGALFLPGQCIGASLLRLPGRTRGCSDGRWGIAGHVKRCLATRVVLRLDNVHNGRNWVMYSACTVLDYCSSYLGCHCLRRPVD